MHRLSLFLFPHIWLVSGAAATLFAITHMTNTIYEYDRIHPGTYFNWSFEQLTLALVILSWGYIILLTSPYVREDFLFSFTVSLTLGVTAIVAFSRYFFGDLGVLSLLGFTTAFLVTHLADNSNYLWRGARYLSAISLILTTTYLAASYLTVGA